MQTLMPLSRNTFGVFEAKELTVST